MTDDQGTLWKQPIEARLWHGCHYLALESTGFKPKETRSLMVSITFFFHQGSALKFLFIESGRKRIFISQSVVEESSKRKGP